MSEERKMFNLRVTEKELFAITAAVNTVIEADKVGDGGLPLSTDEKNSLYGVIRKADAAISEHWSVRA